MKGLKPLSCGIILLAFLLGAGTLAGAENRTPLTVDYADVQAFHSIDNASRALYEGQNALQAGKYSEALLAYTNATELDPSWSVAWYLKAYTLMRLERPAEALTAVDRALALEPSDRDSNSLKADILEDLGRGSEAAPYRAASATAVATSHGTEAATTPAKAALSPCTMVVVLAGLFILSWARGRDHGTAGVSHEEP